MAASTLSSSALPIMAEPEERLFPHRWLGLSSMLTEETKAKAGSRVALHDVPATGPEGPRSSSRKHRLRADKTRWSIEDETYLADFYGGKRECTGRRMNMVARFAGRAGTPSRGAEGVAVTRPHRSRQWSKSSDGGADP